MNLPNFVVLGAQKSASTYLQEQISLHPEVDMAPGEVRAFEDPYYGQEGSAMLAALFSQSTGSLRGIKRPDYLGRPEIPGRIREHLPDAKLFVVLREPVARAVSAYFHMVRHGFVPLRPLDEAMASLLVGSWDDKFPRASQILTFGRYGEHLERYLRHFPSKQIMVFDQTEVTKNPRGALRRAFEFLGADPEYALPERRNTVSNQGVYSPARLRLLRTKNRARYFYANDLSRREPRAMTPWGWVYNATIVGLDRGVLSRLEPGHPPPLSRQVKCRIEEYYSSDREVLGRVLNNWSVEVPWL